MNIYIYIFCYLFIYFYIYIHNLYCTTIYCARDLLIFSAPPPSRGSKLAEKDATRGHTILYTIYSILYTIYTILYYTILYYTIPYYTILYYTRIIMPIIWVRIGSAWFVESSGQASMVKGPSQKRTREILYVALQSCATLALSGFCPLARDVSDRTLCITCTSM